MWGWEPGPGGSQPRVMERVKNLIPENMNMKKRLLLAAFWVVAMMLPHAGFADGFVWDKVRREIHVIQDRVNFNHNGTASEIPRGELFGMRIEARRLVVILDESGSMYEILPTVQKEISRQFPESSVMSATCCYFMLSDEWPWAYFQAGYGYRNMYMEVCDAAQNSGADAIWMFSDFQDPVSKRAITSMMGKLLKRGIKLYIHSVEREPDPSLLHACQVTGGAYTVKNIKAHQD